MTSEERVERLENRVDRIEDDFRGKLESIDAKLTALVVDFARRKECPAPGSCVTLQERIVRLENTHDNLTKTVADLIKWRAWLTGVNLVISTISLAALAALGSYVVKHL